MTKKQARAYLKANPEFAAWVKAKPEMVQRIKHNPSSTAELFDTWKKSQVRKAGLKKLADHYRSMVDQIQELHSLVQRVDHIVNNVKTMAQTVEGMGTEKPEPTTTTAKRSKTKGKK